MTDHYNAECVQNLNEAINRLTDALEISERRNASLECIFRVGVVAFIGLILLVVSVGFKVINSSHAQQADLYSSNIVKALNNIGNNLELFGMMKEMMGSMAR